MLILIQTRSKNRLLGLITDYHMTTCHLKFITIKCTLYKQDAQLSQRDRAAGCVIVFAKSRRLELGDNILRTV